MSKLEVGKLKFKYTDECGKERHATVTIKARTKEELAERIESSLRYYTRRRGFVLR